MQNFIYQITHPWHWLTYGQNATAVAAMAACVGLVGLYFYTRYTRTIMRLQDSTARTNVTPVLVIQGAIELSPADTQMVAVAPGAVQPKVLKHELALEVRNIGQGAALFTRAWLQPVSDKFVLDGSILEMTPGAKESNNFIHLPRSEKGKLAIDELQSELIGRRRLIVVEAIEATPLSLRHQLQIVLTPLGSGKEDIREAMAHADPLLMPQRGLKGRLATARRAWKSSAGPRT